jgi:O-antigen/teichoic acid export membrane protein
MMAVAMIFSGSLANVLGGASGGSQVRPMIMVFAASLPIAAFYELLLALTRGLSQMRPTIVIERILRPLLQVAFVAAAGVAAANSYWLAVAWALPHLLGLLAVGVAVARILKASPGTFPRATRDERRSAVSTFWSFTMPRGVARMAQVGLQRADIAVVTIVAGPAAAALYTAVTRFLVLGQLATTAIQQVSEPQLARLLAKNNRTGTKLVSRQVTLWTILLAWPVYLILAVYADVLLAALFGPAYSNGATGLRLLAAAMLIATAMGPLDVLLLMAGRSTLSLINAVTALALDIAGCLILVPRMGMTGAAVSWAVAILVRNSLCWLQVFRTLRITPVSRDSIQIIGLLIAIFVGLPVAGRLLFPAGFGTDAAVLGAAVVLYAALLWWRRKSLIFKVPGPRSGLAAAGLPGLQEP